MITCEVRNEKNVLMLAYVEVLSVHPSLPLNSVELPLVRKNSWLTAFLQTSQSPFCILCHMATSEE